VLTRLLPFGSDNCTKTLKTVLLHGF
jgi:hypothetical protein